MPILLKTIKDLPNTPLTEQEITVIRTLKHAHDFNIRGGEAAFFNFLDFFCTPTDERCAKEARLIKREVKTWQHFHSEQEAEAFLSASNILAGKKNIPLFMRQWSKIAKETTQWLNQLRDVWNKVVDKPLGNDELIPLIIRMSPNDISELTALDEKLTICIEFDFRSAHAFSLNNFLAAVSFKKRALIAAEEWAARAEAASASALPTESERSKALLDQLPNDSRDLAELKEFLITASDILPTDLEILEAIKHKQMLIQWSHFLKRLQPLKWDNYIDNPISDTEVLAFLIHQLPDNPQHLKQLLSIMPLIAKSDWNLTYSIALYSIALAIEMQYDAVHVSTEISPDEKLRRQIETVVQHIHETESKLRRRTVADFILKINTINDYIQKYIQQAIDDLKTISPEPFKEASNFEEMCYHILGLNADIEAGFGQKLAGDINFVTTLNHICIMIVLYLSLQTNKPEEKRFRNFLEQFKHQLDNDLKYDPNEQLTSLLDKICLFLEIKKPKPTHTKVKSSLIRRLRSSVPTLPTFFNRNPKPANAAAGAHQQATNGKQEMKSPGS